MIEFNASDVRSKKVMQQEMGDITGSHTIANAFGPKGGGASRPKRMKRAIIMDEVDGMGAGDRSGVAELIQMIKNSKGFIIYPETQAIAFVVKNRSEGFEFFAFVVITICGSDAELCELALPNIGGRTIPSQKEKQR